MSKQWDPFKDTLVRYLGYANEVGEAFRGIVSLKVVRGSYGVAFAYGTADAIHKGMVANDIATTKKLDFGTKSKFVASTVADTFVWQLLALLYPPLSFILTQQKFTSLSHQRVKWLSTGVGLLTIPLIVTPIDHSVDWVMDQTLRKWMHTVHNHPHHEH